MIQYLGRISRPKNDKKDLEVYDYVDDYKKTMYMYEKRKNIYKKLGYQIIIEDNGVYQEKIIFE